MTLKHIFMVYYFFTFHIKCDRSLCGSLVSANRADVHAIVTDDHILDKQSSFDYGISSDGERSILFRP